MTAFAYICLKGERKKSYKQVQCAAFDMSLNITQRVKKKKGEKKIMLQEGVDTFLHCGIHVQIYVDM